MSLLVGTFQKYKIRYVIRTKCRTSTRRKCTIKATVQCRMSHMLEIGVYNATNKRGILHIANRNSNTSIRILKHYRPRANTTDCCGKLRRCML